MKKLLLVLCMLLMLCGCKGTSNAKYRVGVVQLVKHDALDKATEGFVDELKAELSDEVSIDVKNASGDASVCQTIATGFVADELDLIMANATPALIAVRNATNQIPVLGTSVTEYGVALDIENFNGLTNINVSGTSDLAPLDEQAKMILDLFPSTKTVGILYCQGEPNSKYQVEVVSKYLESKGIEVKPYAFSDSNDVKAVADEACSNIDVLYIPTDNTCASNGENIKNAASKANVPIITGEKECCLSVGGLATLSIDYYELGKTTAKMAAKILKGEAKVEEMPIEYFENPVKMYRQDAAEKFNIDMPEDYVVIEE